MARFSYKRASFFLLFVCFLVGILTATAAYILKSAIHFFQFFLTENFSRDNFNFSYLLFPIVGILIAGLYVKYVVKDDISHGVTKFFLPYLSAKAG